LRAEKEVEEERVPGRGRGMREAKVGVTKRSRV